MKDKSVYRENPFMWMIKRPKFWIEIIIMLIIPMPMNNPDSVFGLQVVYMDVVNWVDNSNDGYPVGSHIYRTPYLTNDFFLAAMFLRFFFVLQTMIVLSPPNNKLVGKRICHEHDIDPSFTFQMKAAFKERPYLLFMISSFMCILAMASLIRVFEHPYWQHNFTNPPFYYFGDYQTSIWFIIITMSSVGYGDVVAVTPVGRMVTLISTILGAAYLSMMVALVTEWLLLQEK